MWSMIALLGAAALAGVGAARLEMWWERREQARQAIASEMQRRTQLDQSMAVQAAALPVTTTSMVEKAQADHEQGDPVPAAGPVRPASALASALSRTAHQRDP